jgi:hypothetical protein
LIRVPGKKLHSRIPKKAAKKSFYGSADVLTVFLLYLKTYFHRQGGNLGIPYAI